MKSTPGYLRVMGAALAAMLSIVTMNGCSDEVQTVLTGDQCSEACSRYAACYDNAFDTATCSNNCEIAISNNTIAVATTEDCLDCIGDSICVAPTYVCSGACSSIIVIR